MDDTTTDRCESCGHPFDDWCDDECCWWKGERFMLSEADRAYDRAAFARDYGLEW